MQKSSFLFYLDYKEPLELLTDEERGRLLMALLDYARTGEAPQLTGAEYMAFAFIRAHMDRNGREYAEVCERNRENGSKGGRPRKNPEVSPVLEETGGITEKPTETQKPDKDKDKGKEKEKDTIGQGSTGKTPHPHGAYGWVKLTEGEHAALLRELGDRELTRCIAYVDESAQSTGNKNGWRDWALVVKKCARHGWGLGPVGRKGTRTAHPPSYDLPEFERLLMQQSLLGPTGQQESSGRR